MSRRKGSRKAPRLVWWRPTKRQPEPECYSISKLSSNTFRTCCKQWSSCCGQRMELTVTVPVVQDIEEYAYEYSVSTGCSRCYDHACCEFTVDADFITVMLERRAVHIEPAG